MANATLRYQEVGAQGLRPVRSMANATLSGIRSMANATLSGIRSMAINN
jgi:hypothetical protein